MSLPTSPPRLPKLPFIAGDAACLTAAWLISARTPYAFAGTPLIAIVSLVAFGAVLAAFPFVADWTRERDEAADERQRALEALGRTVATSAEQLSIAAAGLHDIAELAQKNLRHAEQLPHKLQEKINAFDARVATAHDDEREELEKELATLRASEGEKLETAAAKIQKSSATLVQLEAAAQKHLADTTAALAKIPETFARSQAESLLALDEKLTASLTAIETQLAASTTAAITALATAEPSRPRKPRREEPTSPATEAAVPPLPESPKSDEPAPVPPETIAEIEPVTPSTAEPFDLPSAAVSESPPPTPAEAPAAVAVPEETPPTKKPRAPRKPKPTAEPIAENTPSLEPTESAPDEPSAEPHPESAIQNPPAEDEFNLPGLVERTLTSDGATRLIATAYIGIGNRLFIRGEGPGLSWEKGIPLQFVSIGKWRW